MVNDEPNVETEYEGSRIKIYPEFTKRINSENRKMLERVDIEESIHTGVYLRLVSINQDHIFAHLSPEEAETMALAILAKLRDQGYEITND